MGNTFHWLTAARARLYARAMLLFTIIVSGHFIYQNFLVPDTAETRRDIDFIAFHAASNLAVSPHPEVIYDKKKLQQESRKAWPEASAYLWLYPPTFLAVISPLALLPFTTAYLAFMAATLLLYGHAARRLAGNTTGLIAALAFPAVTVNILYGQNAFLTAALIMLGLSLLSSRPRLAGVLLGLLIIKPHLGLFIPLALALSRRWQAMAYAAGSAIGLCLLSLLMFGTESWLAFLHGLSAARTYLEQGNLPWERMISVFASVRLLGGGIGMAYALHALVALICCVAMVRTWLRSEDFALRASTLVLATLTLSPYQYDYDLLWLCLPLLLLVRRGLQEGWHRGERELLTIAWLFPLLDLILLHQTVRPSLATLIELLLLWLIMNKLRQQPRMNREPGTDTA